MESEDWKFLLVHYLVLAGIIFLSFGYLMGSGQQFSDIQLFIILFVIIVATDMGMHKINKKYG